MIVDAKTVIDALPGLQRRLGDLIDRHVLVGVPEETAGRLTNPQGSTGVQPLQGTEIADNNAAIAYIQEHGSPAAHIPPRPFLVPGIKEAAGRINPILRHAGEAALNGEADIVDRDLHKVGLICQAEVRRKITQGPFTPLADSTLASRRRRGRKGTRPLIDTGRLRQSITYALEDGDSRTFTGSVQGGGRNSELVK